MEYKVKISEKGKTRTRSILIERVPYKVFIIAQRLEKLVQQVKDDNEIMQAYAEENRELASRKTEGWKETVKANNAEIKILRDDLFCRGRRVLPNGSRLSGWCLRLTESGRRRTDERKALARQDGLFRADGVYRICIDKRRG